MRWRKQVVSPTLLLNDAGVMVEALEHHAFPPGGKKSGKYHQPVQTPQGAAVIAVQFVHEIGERFANLQVFQLSYVHRAPGRDLYEEYLAAPFDSIEMAAQPAGAEVLNSNQRRVLAALLAQSDQKAWEASQAFRQDIEGRG